MTWVEKTGIPSICHLLSSSNLAQVHSYGGSEVQDEELSNASEDLGSELNNVPLLYRAGQK